MPAYEQDNFQPPAPLAYVTVRASATEPPISNVPMLIDTGADVTLLPRQKIATLIDSEREVNFYELEGIRGTLNSGVDEH